MVTNLDRIKVGHFMMRALHRVDPTDYASCATDDPEGIRIIEESTQKSLTTFKTWAEIFECVEAKGNDGLLLRLQLVYARYMIAKIMRVMKGEVPEEDQISLGYQYYVKQLEERISLLRLWVNEHPEDQHLLPKAKSEAATTTQDAALSRVLSLIKILSEGGS